MKSAIILLLFGVCVIIGESAPEVRTAIPETEHSLEIKENLGTQNGHQRLKRSLCFGRRLKPPRPYHYGPPSLLPFYPYRSFQYGPPGPWCPFRPLPWLFGSCGYFPPPHQPKQQLSPSKSFFDEQDSGVSGQDPSVSGQDLSISGQDLGVSGQTNGANAEYPINIRVPYETIGIDPDPEVNAEGAVDANAVLNFALNLEYLEASFYTEALTGQNPSSVPAISQAVSGSPQAAVNVQDLVGVDIDVAAAIDAATADVEAQLSVLGIDGAINGDTPTSVSVPSQTVSVGPNAQVSVQGMMVDVDIDEELTAVGGVLDAVEAQLAVLGIDGTTAL